MAAIRERTIEWLIDHGPGQFTVTQLATDITITRRQALNALHGLNRAGLSDQLQRGSSGMWEFHPPKILVRQEGAVDYAVLPMGFVGKFKVLARAGDRYLVRGVEHGGFAFLDLIDGPIERLDEHVSGVNIVNNQAAVPTKRSELT